jgi:hypothetical protein
VPRTLILAQAPQGGVNAEVRAELEARGALLDERTHARTVFEKLAVPSSLQRGGYVGVYQPISEAGIEVLVQAWATGARRAWWGTVTLQLIVVLLMFATSPPSVAWYNAALVLWPWLIAAGLVYALTFRASREVEDDLAAALVRRFTAAGWKLVTEDEQLEQRVRERLEAERAAREIAARPPPPKPEAPARGKSGLFGPKKERRKA